MTQIRKRLLPIAIFLVGLILLWTIFYWILGRVNGMNWPLLDCFYQTLIHLTPRPVVETLTKLGWIGRFLTVLLLFLGVSAMLYIVSTLTSMIIEGRFSEMYRRKAMLKQIAKLKNHFIVCGANHTAQQVILELIKRQINFVVLESDHNLLQNALSLGNFFHLEGDPTEDENLINAGIKVARGIIIATPSDETNLYITFAVRELNPLARIISRVTEGAAGPRIIRAGANSTVNPDYIGGLRMVSEGIRPAVTSFLDIMMRDTRGVFRIEEAHVQQGSELVNKTLGEACIKEHTGVLVLALRKPGQKDFDYNPADESKLEVGTVLVVLAEVDQLNKLNQLTNEYEDFSYPEAV